MRALTTSVAEVMDHEATVRCSTSTIGPTALLQCCCTLLAFHMNARLAIVASIVELSPQNRVHRMTSD